MTAPRSEVTEVQRIPLDRIKLSPLNVRQSIDVGSLTCSIKRTGLIEPLRLRPLEEDFEIVTGERRFRALKAAGATHADAIVVEGTDEEVITEQWDENEERADYTDYERALKLRQMLDALGLTQTELAERVNLSRNRVNQLLRMLQLEGKVTAVTLSKMTESQVRAILQAPEDVQPSLVNYVELFLEEKGELLPASAIEDYALQLARATEIGRNRRRFLYEIEGEPAPYEPGPEPVEESSESEKRPEETDTYIEEHDLGWVFDAEGNGAGFLTKIAMLTDEELQFCLAHETRPLNLQRLNEEMDGREPAQAPRPLLKEPPTTSAQVIAFITERIGGPVEDLQARVMEEHGLSEEEAQAAIQAYREAYPDIWDWCYPEKDEEPELTVEQYVADVLTHNPEVKHADLIKATVEMFDDITEPYIQGLIDRSRKRRDIYATKSPTTLCPLCGRTNAEKNRILMVLEEYQATQPGITLVDWLREVLA